MTIKRHDSAVDRIKDERGPWADSNPTHRVHIVRTQLAENQPARIELDKLEAERDSSIGDQRAELDKNIATIVDREWHKAVQQYLARTYDEDDTKQPLVRGVCTLSLLVAAIGFFIVLIHRTLLVFRA